MSDCPPDHVKVWDPALQLWKCAHVNDVALAEDVSDMIGRAMLPCLLCGVAEVVHDDAACKAKMAAWRPRGLLGSWLR